MRLFTIGFTKKTAREFFTLLKDNHIRKIVDIRLNNTSQLAGFAKGNDLEFFLEEICRISYVHDTELAPNKEILNDFKNKRISWQQYESLFNKLLVERDIKDKLDRNFKNNFDSICFLCSEETADKCHRRLVAEYIRRNYPDLAMDVVHL